MDLPKIEISADTAKKMGFRDDDYSIRKGLMEFQRLIMLTDGKALSLSATLRRALDIANRQYLKKIQKTQ